MQTQRRDPRLRRAPEGAGGPDPAGALERDPIVSELRQLYNGIIDEPVPDQLIELLRKLDEVERSR